MIARDRHLTRVADAVIEAKPRMNARVCKAVLRGVF